MSSTFLERCFNMQDGTDGGYIDPATMVRPALEAIEADTVMPNTVAYFWNLSSGQMTEFNEILGTMPAQITILSTVLNVNARATWAARTSAPITFGAVSGAYPPFYQNPTAVRSALGI